MSLRNLILAISAMVAMGATGQYPTIPDTVKMRADSLQRIWRPAEDPARVKAGKTVGREACESGRTQQVHYSGDVLSDPSRHDGGLAPAVGVHNIQTMRALRRYDDAETNSNGWTYNHQPMMAYWQGRFYMHYLSNPVDEHVGAGRTMLQTSADGYVWSKPVVLFPVYDVPDGFTKDGTHVARGAKAVMHQRVGWYVSKQGRLIATGNYGIALHPKDDPNDGNGIGRVVREIHADGTMGPIYFIYYNHDFSEENTAYPFYTHSSDKGFVDACREMAANPLYRMQWAEEADRDDPLLPLKQPYKAMCWYTLPDGTIAALWKHALTSTSTDGGNTWAVPVERAPGFVNSNAKIWGQRLSDGTYATVYNPSEYRWPLAISLSADGLDYTTLNLVQGHVPLIRYAGQYKSYGPQYVRGIQEGNGTPPDGDLWVTYSMGKEDMWVSHIPVPVRQSVTAHATDDFSSAGSVAQLREWAIHSPLWAKVEIESAGSRKWLALHDSDPYDYAMAERMIPATKNLEVELTVMGAHTHRGVLHIEMLDSRGTCCARIDFTPDGTIMCKGGARYGNAGEYEANVPYDVKISLSATRRSYTVWVNGRKRSTRMLFAPVTEVCRIRFSTGTEAAEPGVDTPADVENDAPLAGTRLPEAVFYIGALRTASSDTDAGAAVLRAADYKHYVDYFNTMEDENIVQAIPNSDAWQWMQRNIPLFDCPDRQMEEMYYYRWWSVRKHIKNTPAGYGMTEFLVERKYADAYNLISCALGHHIYENRWLRDRSYLDGIIHTWYRGNEGRPMARMMNFSSWAPDAVLARWKVDADTAFVVDMLPDLMAEYRRWEDTHRLPGGLYWQRDVNDGMEESISGARKQHHARPTINSYMYGNAMAISAIARMAGDSDAAALYQAKADTLRTLVLEKLWCAPDGFFETLQADTCARVREAIGFIPWYFGLPDDRRYDEAWLQLVDPKGFAAPYGLTTAERRHPQFRSHGVGKCEWDGAIWPFATSQTLTALAAYLETAEDPVIGPEAFFGNMKLYTESQHHRGRPYIGEYLDETTGYWLKGDQERSRYYNHSTFADLVITGLAGIRPSAGDTLTVNPLIDSSGWDWMCIDNVPYHGRNITVIWDRDGTHYHCGKGLQVLVDGRCRGRSDTLAKITVRL